MSGLHWLFYCFLWLCHRLLKLAFLTCQTISSVNVPARNRLKIESSKSSVAFLPEPPAGTRYGGDTSWTHWVSVRYSSPSEVLTVA
jgi:hypothetical protein